jgi:hypothetical protein
MSVAVAEMHGLIPAKAVVGEVHANGEGLLLSEQEPLRECRSTFTAGPSLLACIKISVPPISSPSFF